jgi:hypothetical protein
MDKTLSPRLRLQVFVDLPFLLKAVHKAVAVWVDKRFPFDVQIETRIQVEYPESEQGSHAVIILHDGLGTYDRVPDSIAIRRHKELSERADIVYQKAVALLETHENLELLGK